LRGGISLNECWFKIKKGKRKLGFSIDDIKNKSKIKKNYLFALENDDFDKLPGEVYTKVYIRGYAKIVGIDPQDILTEYENEKNKDKKIDKTNNRQPKKNKKNKVHILNRDHIFRSILGIILILIVVLLSYNMFFRTEQNENNTSAIEQENIIVQQEDNTNSNNNKTPEEEAVEKNNTEEINTEQDNLDESEVNSEDKQNEEVAEKDAEEKQIEETNETQKVDQSKTEQSSLIEDTSKELKIIATDKSWLSITVDGDLKFQGFINADEVMTYSGNENIRIKIGNGIAVKVEFEGEILGPFGKSGEVIIRNFDI